MSTLTAPVNVTIVGYTVTGWDSSTVSVGNKLPKDCPTSITLTARVTANKYKVTLNANGGSISQGEKTVTYASREELGVPTRTGYSFLGWFSGERQITEENGVCIGWNIADDITLKAEWRANRYAVSVKASDDNAGSVSVTGNTDAVNLYFDNNGVEATNFPTTQEITKETGMQVPSDPTADMYVFKGWYKDSDCEEFFDFSQDIASDVTAYAGWYRYTYTENSTVSGAISGYGIDSAQSIYTSNSDQYRYFAATTDGTYSLYYKNSSSGSSYATYLSIYDVTEGSSIKTNGTISNTSYNNYSFTAKKGHVYYFKVYRYNYSNTFYYYLTRENAPRGGGKIGEGTTAVGEYQSTVKLSASTNSGYTFVGWYNGSTLISTDKSYTATVPASDVTFTAKWTYYTVTTNTNLVGAGTYTEMVTEKVTVGNTVNLTASTNNGYTWLGWYDEETKVSEGTSRTYSFTMTSGNKTLTAKWIVCPVTLEKNIEDTGAVNGIEKTSVGAETTINATANIGYIWLGWYNGINLLTTKLSYTFTMSENSIVYTAKWELCTAHTPNGNCVCTKCGVTAHTPNGYCVCTKCRTTVHTPNENCVCEKCGTTVHGVKENGAYCRHDNNIYFGAYPQTLVRDSALSSALGSYNGNTWTSYEYYKNGSVSDYMYFTDKEYNGEKYRGVYFTAKRPNNLTGSIIGGDPNWWTYDYIDDTEYNTFKKSTVYWFKYEPIKWTVVNEESGLATLVADLILDSQNYYISDTDSATTRTDYQGNSASAYSNNYQYSTIRTWLNVTFYETAFTELQKSLIATTNVDNSVESTGYDSNSYSCENTNDKVYLLSYKEAKTYFTRDSARMKKSSDYAKSQGLWVSTDSRYLDNSYWWLRSPGDNRGCNARYVLYSGVLNSGGYVYVTDRGVVPALTIRLS